MKKIEIIQYEGDAQPRRKVASDTITDSVIVWKWVYEINDTVPAYDSATQKLVSDMVITASEARRTYTVVDLTQAEMDAIVQQKTLQAGYDTGLGYSLRVEDDAQNAFARLLTLLREAGAPDTQDVIIKDKDGVKHTLTYGELKPMIVQYGVYCQQLFDDMN